MDRFRVESNSVIADFQLDVRAFTERQKDRVALTVLGKIVHSFL